MRARMLPMMGAIAMFSLSALADNDHDQNDHNANSHFHATVIGSMPGTPIGGVASGGAPWVVQSGEASVSSEGHIRVEVQGLLITTGGPANFVGTTGPVTMVGATLVCGGTGGAPVSATALTPSPLSSLGNAEINQAVILPTACFGPVVLIRVFNASAPLGSQLGPYIAVTGLTANENRNEDADRSGEDGH